MYGSKQEITDRALAIIQKNETVHDFETIIKNKSGEERIISWYSKNLTDEKRTLIGSVALGLDVTERKQHERELHVVAAVSAALRTANSRVEMLPIILDQVLDLFRADGALLAMRDSDGGDLLGQWCKKRPAHDREARERYHPNRGLYPASG